MKTQSPQFGFVVLIAIVAVVEVRSDAQGLVGTQGRDDAGL